MNAVVRLSSASFDRETDGVEGPHGVDILSVLDVIIEYGASDLYLTVDSVPRYRIEGRIQAIGEGRLSVSDRETVARSTMSMQQ